MFQGVENRWENTFFPLRFIILSPFFSKCKPGWKKVEKGRVMRGMRREKKRAREIKTAGPLPNCHGQG
jgi:hypothetical protein